LNRVAVSEVEERPVTTGAIPRYELSQWRSEFGLVAGITAAHDGAAFGLATNRPLQETLQSWRALMAAVGIPAAVVSRQVHGAAVAQYGEPFPSGLLIRDGFDGHATRTGGVLLAITVADCVPVFLAEPTSGALCLLHAGWRGVAAGILKAGIRALVGVDAPATSNIVMHCGVAICGSCYQVGPEVVEAVWGTRPPGPQQLDLRGALVEQALRLGVGRVSVSPLCTVHSEQRFSSHRGEGGQPGRMAAFLGRPRA
jgi:copper oxidase (laccase) domain-containing protein